MGFFRCFGSSTKKKKKNAKEEAADKKKNSNKKKKESSLEQRVSKVSSEDSGKETPVPVDGEPTAKIFTYQELAAATNHFTRNGLLGEGASGRVYKGNLESTGQVVAVKRLDRGGRHKRDEEFSAEVLMLNHLHHPNLVNLIGYCANRKHRHIVYEFMPLGSLEDRLHDLPSDKEPLNWYTRMKIAAGAARGLEYLHDTTKPPVIHRDMKSSNILLDEGYHPKLSDFGIAKLGPVGEETHVSTRVLGTPGYCAPEYVRTGKLTLQSDIYSFGVVLLELITGRRPVDYKRIPDEQFLVLWAHTSMLKDRKKLPQMADPLLQGRYPTRGLCQAITVAEACLQEYRADRPVIKEIVTALSILESEACD